MLWPKKYWHRKDQGQGSHPCRPGFPLQVLVVSHIKKWKTEGIFIFLFTSIATSMHPTPKQAKVCFYWWNLKKISGLAEKAP